MYNEEAHLHSFWDSFYLEELINWSWETWRSYVNKLGFQLSQESWERFDEGEGITGNGNTEQKQNQMLWSGYGVKPGENENTHGLIDKSCHMEEVKGQEEVLNFFLAI